MQANTDEFTEILKLSSKDHAKDHRNLVEVSVNYISVIETEIVKEGYFSNVRPSYRILMITDKNQESC